MRARDLHLSLEGQSPGPLYLQVAGAVLQAIREGRVECTVALPGIRELAERLGVHRNTVLAALRELEAQGWVEARARAGFFVSAALPEGPGAASAPAAAPEGTPMGFDLPARLRPLTDAKGLVMDLSEGVADARQAPTDALARAYQRALRLKGPQLLGATEFKGLRRLRETLAHLLAQQRGLSVDPEQLLLIRSTSMAVSLVAQALLGPEGGDVAVENPGYPTVWETLRQASAARLHALPVDGEGLRVEALEALLASTPLALLVLTPQCHFPTGVALAPNRRTGILELACQHRFAVLELDLEYDYLANPAPAPLAAQDHTGQVLYVGSLSRAFAPGLRLGYIAVPPPLADGLAKARQRMDWQGEAVLEWAISELILDGELERHVRRVRRAAQERREALEDALRHGLGDRLRFDSGRGGMALWLEGTGRLADPVRFDMWVRSCGLRGLKLRPGGYFDLEGRPGAATRLGFTAYLPEELQRAVSMMV
jgi:GntR family transcriptional regulator / MocR family aminotransferase